MEPADLVKILERLRKVAPDVYRHIIGVVRAVVALK
jgi:hypothetical protein